VGLNVPLIDFVTAEDGDALILRNGYVAQNCSLTACAPHPHAHRHHMPAQPRQYFRRDRPRPQKCQIGRFADMV